jgi:hypothetical protein
MDGRWDAILFCSQLTMKTKAIIVGLLIDIAGSAVVGIVLGIGVALVAVATGSATPEAIGALGANVFVKAIGLAGTTFFTALGGYVAARMSKPNGIRSALAVGVISLLLGVALAVALPGVTPQWKLIAGLLLTLPAAFVGGRIAKGKTQLARATNGSQPASLETQVERQPPLPPVAHPERSELNHED